MGGWPGGWVLPRTEVSTGQHRSSWVKILPKWYLLFNMISFTLKKVCRKGLINSWKIFSSVLTSCFGTAGWKPRRSKNYLIKKAICYILLKNMWMFTPKNDLQAISLLINDFFNLCWLFFWGRLSSVSRRFKNHIIVNSLREGQFGFKIVTPCPRYVPAKFHCLSLDRSVFVEVGSGWKH